MTNYWAIAPWPNDNDQIFEQVWAYDREHGTIAIRWHQLGDLAGLSRSQIEQRYVYHYKRESAQSVQMLYTFYNKIAIGDVIIARRGRYFCIGIGRVTREAYYDLEQARERLNGLSTDLSTNFIEVNWQRLAIIPVREVFAIKTVSNIGEAKYRRLFERGT